MNICISDMKIILEIRNKCFLNVFFFSFILTYKIETEVRLNQVHVTLKHDVTLISDPDCNTCHRETQFVGAFRKSMEEFVGCKAHKYEPKPKIVYNPVYNPLAQVSLLTG